MAIPNNSPATAIKLTPNVTLPLDIRNVTIAEGAWYYITVPPNVFLIGVKMLDNTPDVEGVQTYTDAGITEANWMADYRNPINQPVTPGNNYYFKIVINNEPTVTTICNFGFHFTPAALIQAGDIVINDDGGNLPALVFDPTGNVRSSINIPAGESFDISASDGIMCIPNKPNADFINIYDKNINLLFHTPNPLGTVPTAVSYDQTSLFYLFGPGVGGPNKQIRAINKLGVISPTIWTLPVNSLGFVAANIGGSILYWATHDNAQSVRTWNTVTNTEGAQLVPGITEYNIWELIVLKDGTILVAYEDGSSPKNAIVKRYNASGTTLNTYTLATSATLVFDHAARALDDPTSFWVWMQDNPGAQPQRSIYSNIRTSDGVVLSSFTKIVFGNGYSTSNAPISEYFGPAPSCPMLVIPLSATAFPGEAPPVAAPDGIYMIRPIPANEVGTGYRDRYNNGVEKKIPDPTIRTAGIGE